MKKATIIEITTFHLNNGVPGADFLQAADKMQREFLSKQDGFVQRSLTQSEDGTWRDIILWTSKKSMDQALKKAMQAEAAIPFMGLIDPNSVEMEATRIEAHYE